MAPNTGIAPSKSYPQSIQRAATTNRLAPRYQSTPRNRGALGVFFAIVAALALPIVLLLGLYASFEGAGLILPGVKVMEMPLSSLTRQQAEMQLNDLWNIRRTLTLTLEDSVAIRTWQSLPVEYGIYLDAASTVQAAYSSGRSTDGEMLKQILSRSARSIPPVVVFNPALARAQLENIAALVNVVPQDAALKFENGIWSATQGKAGLALDVEAALVQISADPLLMLMQGQIKLTTHVIAPAVADLSAVALRNQTLLNKPLKLTAYDAITNDWFSWSISAAELAPYIKVENPLSEKPAVSLDGKLLDTYLSKWQKESLGSGRVFEAVHNREKLSELWQNGKELFAMVRHLPTAYVVQPHDTLYSISARVGIPYWRIENANPGIKANGFSTGQKLVIPSKNDMLPLPVVLNKRIVISISEQHMWAYENGKLRSEHVISSGMANSPTMPGVFQVTEHIINAYGERWDLWMPHWLSIYEAVPGFFNGIHGLPLLRNGVRLWANVLGQPASYGCIILGLKEAENIYQWAENGVVVEIRR